MSTDKKAFNHGEAFDETPTEHEVVEYVTKIVRRVKRKRVDQQWRIVREEGAEKQYGYTRQLVDDTVETTHFQCTTTTPPSIRALAAIVEPEHNAGPGR